MKLLKEKLMGGGGIVASLGGIGVVIAEVGLCACFWAPLFSLAGLLAITVSFLSDNRFYLLIIGALLLILGLIFHKRKKVCKVHRKK